MIRVTQPYTEIQQKGAHDRSGAPPGNYPPPPPTGSYPPPQGSGYPPAPTAAPPSDAYTPFLTRVLAFLIDYLPYAVIVGIGYGIEAATQETVCATDTSEYSLGDLCGTGNSTLGVARW